MNLSSTEPQAHLNGMNRRSSLMWFCIQCVCGLGTKIISDYSAYSLLESSQLPRNEPDSTLGGKVSANR